MTSDSNTSKSIDSTGFEADHVVSLAREAFSACKKAMSIAKHAKNLEVDVYDSRSLRYASSRLYLFFASVCVLKKVDT